MKPCICHSEKTLGDYCTSILVQINQNLFHMYDFDKIQDIAHFIRELIIFLWSITKWINMVF